MTYTITSSGFIRNSLGSCIPQDPNNADYQRYLKWVADGNTAEVESPPSNNKPDWSGFYSAFMSSDTCAYLVSLASPAVSIALGSFMTVVASGMTKPQVGSAASITWQSLISALAPINEELTSDHLDEMDTLLAAYRLTKYFGLA